MDIIVELSDGSIADVEIHKSPYTFTGERISCYSSDLLLRQYSKVRGTRGKRFRYNDLCKVYTIVIYEKTADSFHSHENTYLHRGYTVFDSGLELNMLQNYYLVALDVFKKIAYHKENSRLSGWLSLLVTEDVDDIDTVTDRHPWLAEIYQEIAKYRSNPAEVFNMYSQMLRELDRNSIQYIIDEQKVEINELKEENAAQKEENVAQKEAFTAALADKDAVIAEMKVQLDRLQKELAAKH